ncbi:restriction endonuclease [Escherichia coli]|nr:restriction endonuclease [Escherichia coli]
MTTTIDKNQWCGQFKRCNGCKLQSECMVKPEEMFPVMEDGKYVDKCEPPRKSWRLNSLRKR